MHICTTEDLMGDAIIINSKCPFCDFDGKHRLGWVAIQCTNCKTYWELEYTLPDIVKKMREELKLSRWDLFKLTGYKPSTIKRYEFTICTIPYYRKIKELFIKKINERTNQTTIGTRS